MKANRGPTSTINDLSRPIDGRVVDSVVNSGSNVSANNQINFSFSSKVKLESFFNSTLKQYSNDTSLIKLYFDFNLLIRKELEFSFL